MADLSPLQREVLRAFFARERGFFLTGGGALAGYYLHHRSTDDLDLFTDGAEAYERGRHALAEVAASLGAKLEVRMDAPDFKRYAIARGAELVVVDLVHDRVPQLVPDKPEIEGVRVDSLDEILANKLTALVGRQEERDVVDVYFLEQAGHRVEDALPAALTKDGGCTPANLAWLLSQLEIPGELVLPPPLTPERLRGYVADLVKRFRRAAMPAP
jgi:predicted nucleotidyltransferase component of viral defense system